VGGPRRRPEKAEKGIFFAFFVMIALVPAIAIAQSASGIYAKVARDVVALYPLNNDNFPVSLAVDNYQGVRNQTDEI
jgi:hypothetical protein